LKFNCKYHHCELVESVHNPKEAMVCKQCKKENEPGRDGIYYIEDLKKGTSVSKLGSHIREAMENKETEKKSDKGSNIYDSQDWDFYSGF